MSKLFSPLVVGESRLSHRLAMAPLTRYRADDEWVPLPFVKDYYEQRASVPGTLIISEATLISTKTAGERYPPGIWNDAQISAWGEITDAVHAKGGVIYCQLRHLGRTDDPAELAKLGHDLVSSSAVPVAPGAATPREMTEAEIQETIADFATAARNAVERAGFDGVEIHGANGQLLDQFLQDVSNRRSDRWGGSIENRARLHLDVARAVVDAVGASRTAIRLSPYSNYGGMLMDDPDPTFRYLVEQLRELRLAYLHLVEARVNGPEDADPGRDRSVRWLVELWGRTSPVVIAGGFTPKTARTAVDETFKGLDVIVAFGRHFVSNPDLVFRVKEGLPLAKYNRATFYTPKLAEGYVDYPFSEQYLAGP